LFNNLEKTLLNVNPFNLEFKKFSKEMVWYELGANGNWKSLWN
jgi:hypothetical protein